MEIKNFLKKKRIVIPLFFLLVLFLLNVFKYEFVFYIPFSIPGSQMAATVPPFGIFIESKYKNENTDNPCSILKHERVHWMQYQRMGFFSFYFNYASCFLKSGRFDNWMEDEARRPCNDTKHTH